MQPHVFFTGFFATLCLLSWLAEVLNLHPATTADRTPTHNPEEI